MSNSRLKRKVGQCSDCLPASPEKPLIAGRCSMHYGIYRTQIQRSKRKKDPKRDRVSVIPKPIDESKLKLELYFKTCALQMTGVCYNCGGQTTKGDPIYERYSIAHLFAKALFPSIAAHPFNNAELCHFGNSCHANFDNNGYEYAKEKMPKLWELIVKRFKILYRYIPQSERSKIPDILKEFI